MLLENTPWVECMDKGLCFLLKHGNIIATANWIFLLKHSFVISQGQPCWHTFHELLSAKNNRPIKCLKPKLTPLYFHSSHAWYAWLLYYKIQQFFIECVIMHECNNNFAFHLHSTIYTSILNIHCFFFPLVYNKTYQKVNSTDWTLHGLIVQYRLQLKTGAKISVKGIIYRGKCPYYMICWYSVIYTHRKWQFSPPFIIMHLNACSYLCSC